MTLGSITLLLCLSFLIYTMGITTSGSQNPVKENCAWHTSVVRADDYHRTSRPSVSTRKNTRVAIRAPGVGEATALGGMVLAQPSLGAPPCGGAASVPRPPAQALCVPHRGCPSGRNPGAKVRLCRAQHSEPCRTSPWEPLGPGPSLRQPSPSWPTWRFTPMATLRPALSLRRTRPRSNSGQRPRRLHSPGPADLAGMAVTASVCVAG